MQFRREYNLVVIGANLKRLRKNSNLSVIDVRDYMRLESVQSIYKWERGDCLPQADTLMALMELYGVSNINVITGVSDELAPVVFEKNLNQHFCNTRGFILAS